MGDNIFWYFAGLLTVPVLGGLWLLVMWTFEKTSGTAGCVTECRGSRREMEIGDHFNLTVWLYSVRHLIFWSYRKSHKAAVLKYWQDLDDQNAQSRTDVGVIHRIR